MKFLEWIKSRDSGDFNDATNIPIGLLDDKWELNWINTIELNRKNI